MKCYLESSRDEPNTKIYERLGFRKVKTMVCDDNEEVCKIYCMIRDPIDKQTCIKGVQKKEVAVERGRFEPQAEQNQNE